MRAAQKNHFISLMTLEEFVELNIPAMKQELDSKIIKIEQKSDDLYVELNENNFIDSNIPYEPIIKNDLKNCALYFLIYLI